jgi:agmatine/peptidylarginine deiminase
MIPDWKVSRVFISDLLESHYPEPFKILSSRLNEFGTALEIIPGTKDIWVRDFMPVKLANDRMISYQFFPDYLNNTVDSPFRSNTEAICEAMNMPIEFSSLILDGDNIIKSDNSLILTDKIYFENTSLSKYELERKIKDTFEIENLIILPWDRADRFGHADGMVRFINNETVLIQGYYREMSLKFQRKFFGALEDAGLNWLELKFDFEYQHPNNWAYINFLQTKDYILVPELGIAEDTAAIEQIRDAYSIYPSNKVQGIKCAELIRKGGGGLNCITWTF